VKQWEAVRCALEQLGGQATLAEIYSAVQHIKECRWGTKMPFASIRRILQTRPEFVRIRPGLWALKGASNRIRTTALYTHAFYQRMLVAIGNWRGFATYVPPPDRGKTFSSGSNLEELCTLHQLPECTYPHFVKIMGNIDVVWINRRNMPEHFFEVEHTTNFRDSLVKFVELQDFAAGMTIVAEAKRRPQFERIRLLDAFTTIRQRVTFVDYEQLSKLYEAELQRAAISVL